MYGRGACDAKGILAAQVAAADRLRRDGESRVGLVFVVGEERGSDGARKANDAAPAAAGFSWTASRPTTASASRRAGFCASGCAPPGAPRIPRFPNLANRRSTSCSTRWSSCGRSSCPTIRCSAERITRSDLIAGGVAPNVVSPSAEAEVMFRTVSDAEEVRRAVAPLEPRVTIEHVLEVPPVTTDDGARVRRGGVSLHHRHSVSDALGRAAAVRSRFDSRGAYGGRVRLDRGADRSGGSVRQDCPTPPRRPALNTSAAWRPGASAWPRSIAAT